MNPQKVCLECHAVLKGRADKKYCDDYCRSSYHNRLNIDTRNYIRKINYVLRRNRRVLNDLFQKEQFYVDKSLLASQGFCFDYHTNLYIRTDGNECFYSYDFGYIYLDAEKCLIIQNDV